MLDCTYLYYVHGKGVKTKLPQVALGEGDGDGQPPSTSKFCPPPHGKYGAAACVQLLVQCHVAFLHPVSTIHTSTKVRSLHGLTCLGYTSDVLQKRLCCAEDYGDFSLPHNMNILPLQDVCNIDRVLGQYRRIPARTAQP